MPIVAWILERLTGKVALPIILGLVATNLVSGIGWDVTRHTLKEVRKDLRVEKAVHQADIATWAAATAKAAALDAQHALDVARAQDKITTENENALQDNLAAARAAAARVVHDRAGPADQGSRGTASVPAAAEPANGSAQGTSTVVLPASDAEACAIAWTVAKGWQDWWREEVPVWQKGAAPSVPTNGAVVPPVAMRTQGLGADSKPFVIADFVPPSPAGEKAEHGPKNHQNE